MPNSDYIGKWTIYNEGHPPWPARVKYGAQFEISVDDAGGLRIDLLRGFDNLMANPGNARLVVPPGRGERLSASFPGIGRDVEFKVTKHGVGRHIALSTGEEKQHHDPKQSETTGLFINHGGPHGVDS